MPGFEGIGLHLNEIEVFWVTTTWLGFLLIFGFFRETIGDKRRLITEGTNGAAMIVANAGIRRHWIKLGIAGCLTLSASISALYPTPPPDGARALSLISLSLVPLLVLILNTVDRAEKLSLMRYFLEDHETVLQAEDRIEGVKRRDEEELSNGR